jgi:hypothetical protein
MKPALILGLALAANAMATDSSENNELFVAPQGKLADLAKKYPGMIMFDEQADDELIAMNIPREKFKTEQEWKRYLISKSEEIADDELMGGAIGRWYNQEEKWRKYFTSKSEEVADDEFFSRTRGLFKTESEWRNYIASTQPPAVKPQKVAHDDELAMRNPTPEQYQRLEHKNLLYKSAEEADNELFVGPSKDVFKIHAELLKKLVNERVRYDDEELFANHKTKKPKQKPQESIKATEQADDEFRTKIVHHPTSDHLAYAFDDDELVAVKIPREKFPTEESYRRNKVSLSDDELWTTIQSGNRTIVIHGWEIQARDDEVIDDLLLASNEHEPKNQPDQDTKTIIIHHWAMQTRDDEANNDELLASNQSGPAKQPDQNTRTIIIHHWDMRKRDDEVADEELAVKVVNIPAAENGNVAFDDDELAFRAPRVFLDRHLHRPNKNHTSEAYPILVKPGKDTTIEGIVRDDEADDELHYLGQLLKDQIPKPFRRFDDNEFRAKGEKPAHVKIQEMGTEGPKMKRKLRPIAEN